MTRGLVSHLNSEAELAQVIGHEIGNVDREAQRRADEQGASRIDWARRRIHLLQQVRALGGALETG